MCGTLGDAFIVYCKLYNYWKKTGERVRLHRYSTHINLDKTISSFFANIPFAEYALPCKCTDNPEDIGKDELLAAPYVNVYWDGNARGEDINDPEYIEMEPNPPVFIQPDARSDKKKFCVGVQLNCGSYQGNGRGISLGWVRKLRKTLPADKYSISIFGVLGEKDDINKIEAFCSKNNIENYIGKSPFTTWLSQILALDFFITFEGFPAYFAMSQKVQSLVFFVVPSVLARMPPVWRRENIIWRIEHPTVHRLLRHSPHYAPHVHPIDVQIVKNMVELKTTYT
jgi:hypothetical protein